MMKVTYHTEPFCLYCMSNPCVCSPSMTITGGTIPEGVTVNPIERPPCPGCAERDRRIAELQESNADYIARAAGIDPDRWPDDVPQLKARTRELEAEVAEWVQDAFCEGAILIPDGEDKAGWWDSCAKSSVMIAGDRLVAMGLWERHPDGYGRRWFYRPLSKPE